MRLLPLALAICVLSACSAASGSTTRRPRSSEAPSASTLHVAIGNGTAGAVIRPDFLGLSFETPTVHQPAIVTQAPSLVRLLEGLGTGVLRISGDSVDRTQWLPAPTAPAPWAIATLSPADLANLAALMRASGWRLVLGLDLGHAIPAAAVDEARTAAATLGASLAALEIGNEPDLYTRPTSKPFRSQLGAGALRPAGWELDQYETESALLATTLSEAGSRTPLWGPDTATKQWLIGYAAQARTGVSVLTPHVYPLDRCTRGGLTRGPSVRSLLSRRVRMRESRLIASYLSAASARALPLRIDETNSVACAGQPGVSDTFAAALWALDYGLTAARDGVSGLNFHGGLGSCSAGGTIVASWYSPLCALADGQLRPRPEYYALLLLRSLEGCAFLQTGYQTSRNVSVYALRAPDGTQRVVIDDMDLASAARRDTRARGAPGRAPEARAPAPVSVTLQADTSYRYASVTRLTAPSVHAKHGLSLGGASLRPDGSFAGAASVPISGGAGRFTLRVAAGSAALVVLGR